MHVKGSQTPNESLRDTRRCERDPNFDLDIQKDGHDCAPRVPWDLKTDISTVEHVTGFFFLCVGIGKRHTMDDFFYNLTLDFPSIGRVLQSNCLVLSLGPFVSLLTKKYFPT